MFGRRATLLLVELLVWLVAFALTAVPVGGLLLDRLFDVPARRYFALLGIPWPLLVGNGSLVLAIAWGIFVWLAMMVVMPPMMPMVRFPAWFPIVPLIAHVAFALPVAWVAFAFLAPSAGASGLVGLLR